jgi:branched-chain amino acid transport system ATP-binding protein
MLKITDLEAGYGDLKVLESISLEVNKGEMIAILGANGAGKSTTLKTISGLLHPSSGEVFFEGNRIGDLPPFRIVEKGISLVPEGRRLFPYVTVFENLLAGAYTKEARGKKGDTLEWVFSIFPILKERTTQLASTLSGGEQQMLAIGRGLMSRPRLLMLDEPSIGLAPILVTRIFKTVSEINKEGVTILIVEQNVKQTLSIINRAYILENGRIVMHGGKELLDNKHIKKAYLGL